MPITNFPGGLTSFGVPLPSDGLIPATGGKTIWLGNRSGLPSGDGADPTNPISTLNLALAKTTGSAGDSIALMPGTVVSITSADQMSNLLAYTNIVGLGIGDQRPIIRWSAAAGTFLLDVAGTVLRNCRLQMAGDPAATTALTVAAPITVSGTGCSIIGCDINVGVDADQIITLGINVTGADFEFARNRVHGATAAEITAANTVMRLTAADRAWIHDNYFSAALATDTDGLIETLTTASLDIDITDNFFYSNGSGSTCCVDFGASLACTGKLQRNLMVVDADGTAETVVFTRSATNNLALLDNFFVSNNNERGLVIGTATT